MRAAFYGLLRDDAIRTGDGDGGGGANVTYVIGGGRPEGERGREEKSKQALARCHAREAGTPVHVRPSVRPYI